MGRAGAVVEAVELELPGEGGTLDVRELAFIDHHGLVTLDRHAGAHGDLELLGASPLVRRPGALLRSQHLRPVT